MSLAVTKATSSIKPRAIVSGSPSAIQRRDELYKMYRMTERGEPCGNPMVSCLGSKRKSPSWKVGDMFQRKLAMRRVKAGQKPT